MSGYGVFARYYDALTQNVDYYARADFLKGLIHRHGGREDGVLLDLACGTGSLSFALANQGFDVIGVDASPDMLSIAQQKAGQAASPVLFLCQDMTLLDLFGTVDITICALDSLNHLPDEKALLRTFQRVSLFTNPGGLFIFDVNTEYKHRTILGDNAFVYEAEEVFCVWQNRYQPEDKRVRIILDFFEKSSSGSYHRSRESFFECAFSPEFLESALQEAGFHCLGVYDDNSLDTSDPTPQRAIYVAQKLGGSK